MKLLPCPLALLLLCSVAPRAADWPHPRGPTLDGRAPAAGTFESGAFGLSVAWRAPLGSGYSGIVVAGDRAITLYADRQADWVAAADVQTGQTLWRQRLGDLSRGKDGADDGPLSSPVIGGDLVYALHPGGRLVALRLADGSIAWEASLTDFGVKPEGYGVGTTPVVAGSVLIVQAGGTENRSVVGLDAKSGKQLWAQGEGAVAYQSPAVMTLAGKSQVVVVGAQQLSGLDPATGAVLWQHALAEDEWTFSSSPSFIGDDRFLTFLGGDAAVYRVSKGDAGLEAEALYKTKELGENYAPPVYHEGHLYGFRGQILTCLKAENGERVWRSREPGGDGLILVDRQLVIFGQRGNVVVADASPAGYRERSRVAVLGGSSLTWPSFADGRVFVRNLAELAAVDVGGRGAALAASVSALAGTEFGRWVERVRAAENRAAMVDELFARHPETPILEGRVVHFVYRGPETDVGIAGSMLDVEKAESLERLVGTDLFYRSYTLEPGARWEYHFQLDYDKWIPDPRNARQVPALEGENRLSEFSAAGYPKVSHLEEPSGPRGRVEEFKLTSKALGGDKTIQVWLPPGYDQDSRAYPLLVVNDGKNWLERGMLATTLDNLVGRKIAPVVVAFVEPAQQWWLEVIDTGTDPYIKMLGEELVPALAERYRLSKEQSANGVMGSRFYAFSAVYAALKYPQVFGHVGVQSPVHRPRLAEGRLKALIDQRAGSNVRFYLDWNRYDERNIDRDWDVAGESRALAALLDGGGYQCTGGEALDSYGWSSWRNRSDRVLEAMFPKVGG